MVDSYISHSFDRYCYSDLQNPFQDFVATWTDGSPVMYTKWLVPNDVHLPQARGDCYTINKNFLLKVCETIHIDDVIERAASKLQPYTDGGRRMCGGAIYHDNKFAWLMVPCTEHVHGLTICEQDTNVLHQYYSNNSLEHNNEENMGYPRYVYPHSYLYRYMGYMYMSDDELQNIYDGSQPQYPEYIRSDAEELYTRSNGDGIVQNYYNVRFCQKDGIYISNICFKVIANDRVIHDNRRYIPYNLKLHAGISVYLDQWFQQESKIYFISHCSTLGACVCDTYIFDRNHKDELVKLNIYVMPRICYDIPVPYLVVIQKPMIKERGCPLGTYQCTDSTCISGSYRCDGHLDCVHGDDEAACTGMCSNSHDNLNSNASESADCDCGSLYTRCDSTRCLSWNAVSSWSETSVTTNSVKQEVPSTSICSIHTCMPITVATLPRCYI